VNADIQIFISYNTVRIVFSYITNERLQLQPIATASCEEMRFLFLGTSGANALINSPRTALAVMTAATTYRSSDRPNDCVAGLHPTVEATRGIPLPAIKHVRNTDIKKCRDITSNGIAVI